MNIGEKQSHKTVGILNEGVNNQFIDNVFDGLDVGIHDKGKNTVAFGNKFTGSATVRWYQIWWGQLAILIVGGLVVAYMVYVFGWN